MTIKIPAQPANVSDAAEQPARAWVEAINSNNRAAWRKFIGTNPDTSGHSGGFPGISSELVMFAGSDFTAVVLSNYGFASQNVTGKIRGLVR